jgi:hypothetical protein
VRGKIYLFLLAILCGIILFSACAQYKITKGLEQPINDTVSCNIGEIMDELPVGFEEEDKPTLEHIEKFRSYLKEEVEKEGIFKSILIMNPEASYEVTGSILDFKKGSGAVRFIGLFGAGNAKLTTSLKLIDKNTGEILFAGNFKQTVSSWLESGDNIFQKIAHDFAKELKKQNKKLEKKK